MCVGEGASSARTKRGENWCWASPSTAEQHESSTFTDIIPIHKHNRRVVIFLDCCFCHFCCVRKPPPPPSPPTHLTQNGNFLLPLFFFHSLSRPTFFFFFFGNLHNFEVFLFILVCVRCVCESFSMISCIELAITSSKHFYCWLFGDHTRRMR